MALLLLIERAVQRIRRDAWRAIGIDALTGARIRKVGPILRLGSTYGGWQVPGDYLKPGAVCYCVGAGEDISFDLALLARFQCEVHTFDPTPRAIQHVNAAVEREPRLRFHPVGLWDSDEVLRFYAPRDPTHVSHSALNLQGTTEYFEAPCRSVASMMAELRHDHIDLLKMDVEGAEHRVIARMLADGVRPSVLCVEFDEAVRNLTAEDKARIQQTVQALLSSGYALTAQEGRSNYTFVRSEQ